jgi:hypothetical protein
MFSCCEWQEELYLCYGFWNRNQLREPKSGADRGRGVARYISGRKVDRIRVTEFLANEVCNSYPQKKEMRAVPLWGTAGGLLASVSFRESFF